MLRKVLKMLTVRETDQPRIERLLPTLLQGSTVAAVIMIGVSDVLFVVGPSPSPVSFPWMFLVMSLLLLVATLGIRRLSRRVSASKTINLLLGLVTLYITLTMPPGSLAVGPVIMMYALPVTTAALLLTPEASLVWAVIATLAMLARTLVVALTSDANLNPAVVAGGIASLHLLAILEWFFVRSFYWTQQALRRQIDQNRTGVEIGRMVTAAFDPSAVTRRAVQMIHSAFGYYHVGLFVLDPGDDIAVLTDAAGEAAAGLKERGFPIPLAGTTAVAVAISQKRRRTLLSWKESIGPGGRPVQFTYERLPSRAELVIPLQVGDQVLGALDIHSLELDPFTEDDVHLLEGLAGNIANALASARLLADIQRRHEGLSAIYDQTERRARYLQTTADLARAISSLLDPQELPHRAVELISTGLNLYHAGIFLVDETGEWAVLVAASSEGGKRMLARDHRLRVGEQGIVGWVTHTGHSRIALDVGDDAVHFRNPDLQDTRSEIALPLKVGDRVIGALDVQSTQEGAFSREDATVLQTLADQIVVAIENARLFQATQQALEEVQTLQRHYAAQEWERLSVDRDDLKAQYRSLGVPSLETAWTPEMEIAWANESPVALQSALAVPIRLRGEVIGVLDLQDTNDSRPWTEEEIALVTTVTDQLSLALENARLFEEAQVRAEEMAALNELGQALTTRLDVEGVLDEAYRGASRLLDTTNFYVALYDHEFDSISFPLATEDGRQVEWPPRQMGPGLTEHIVRNPQPLLIPENVSERLIEMGIEQIGQAARSWLGVPLIAGDRVLGVMAVQSHTTPGAYDERHRDLLVAIASPTSIALQNARSFEQVQRRARRERLIREITARIRRTVDVESILQTTVQELGKALGASRGLVRLGTEAELATPPIESQGDPAKSLPDRHSERSEESSGA